MSSALKGSNLSEEHKAKISASCYHVKAEANAHDNKDNSYL
jgi:hypothetical protein